MASLNRCQFIGNLGADPEVRQAGDKPVCNFRIACSEQWKDRSDNKQERTEWVSVQSWGPLADVCGKYLAKGKQVYVEGRLQTRKWQDKDGKDRYTTEIVADKVLFLGGGKGEASEGPRDTGRADTVPADDDGSSIPF